MSEQFKPVVGWEGLYDVSDDGRVWSVRRASFKAATKNSDGYEYVQLWEHNRPKLRAVHHLVLTAFVGKRPAGGECNHLDGNKSNNRAENLEWTTRSGNNQHAYDLGLKHPKSGSRNGRAKLTEGRVRMAKAMHRSGQFRIEELGHVFGVTGCTVRRAITGETWKDDSDE